MTPRPPIRCRRPHAREEFDITTVAAPTLTSLHDRLAETVAEIATRLKVPGVAVGVYLGGEEDYVFHGVTSIENPLEVNENTLFQIGSTSKTYTATALAILAEQGRVDLQERVRTYIPELKLKDEAVAAEVRVINLLNHTGGWAGDIFEDTGNGDDALAVYVAKLVEVDQLAPLGTVASYNNAAFSIAGRVIEKVTGKTFEAAIRELVFEPLGLEQSFYYDGTIVTRRTAVGHKETDGAVSVARNWPVPRSANPAGGVISTIGDQVKYARFHLGDGTGKDGRAVLPASTLELMRTPTFALNGGALGDHVGISWLLRTVDGVRFAAHGGATNGQMAAFDTSPERDFAVAVLTNANAGALLHRELVEWIHEQYLGITRPADEPVEASAEELTALAGEYNAGTAILSITVDGDHLVLKQRPTEEGIRQMRAFLGEDPPETPAFSAKLITGDRFVVLEGPAKGLKGTILRADGDVTGVVVGGRAAYRTS